ncbi:MAG TPA: glycosyltransferase, partial [Saprospiraceae bacterium]|nr:glycosyltransferase [Saprospiraceae bacterium]
MTADTIKSSLIIATYNWKDALELVLKSVLLQSKMPYEVIIADDGSKEDTRQLIEHYKNQFPIPLRHIWHEDKGFRLSEIRNKAINAAKGNYIIQIDGDTILHKHFIKDHEKFAKKGQFISGSRVLLCEDFSKKILQSKKFKFNIFSKHVKNKHYHLRLPLLAKFLAKPTHDVHKVITSVRGCNMSFWKDDLLEINGYNEDMTGWGREDSEISARLINLGLSQINLKFRAIQYHIYNPESSRDSLNIN